MENNKKNEELQSRRDFFKKAAKAVLPVIGAIIVSNIPSNKLNASEMQCYCTSCVGSCSGDCYSTCLGGCMYSCPNSCQNTCKGTCAYTCSTTCSGGCSGMNMF